MRACYLLALCLLLAPLRLAAQDPVTRADSLRNAGKFSAAVALLRTHVQANPGDTRAQAMLAETLTWLQATSPWLRFEAGLFTDNQPIDRFTAGAETGYYLKPQWPWRLSAQHERAEADLFDATLLRLQSSISGYVTPLHTELTFTAGAIRSTFLERSKTHGVGALRAAVRIGGGLKAGGEVERALYTATVASLGDPVLFTRGRGLLQLERAGWYGEAALGGDRFSDDNTITTAYAWLVATLVARTRASVHAGYAFSFQDARETRFMADLARLRGTIYSPYFTPENEVQHSVAGAVALGGATRLTVNGSYAVHATRDAPYLAGRNVAFRSETFHPYSVTATMVVPLTRRLSLTPEFETMRTAFYRASRARAALQIKFGEGFRS